MYILLKSMNVITTSSVGNCDFKFYVRYVSQDETKFENVSKFTANTGRIKNCRISTVGQYNLLCVLLYGLGKLTSDYF